MKFHLATSLVIYTYLSMAIARTVGYGDYDTKVPMSWYLDDTLNDEADEYEGNEDYEETAVGDGKDNINIISLDSMDDTTDNNDNLDDYSKTHNPLPTITFTYYISPISYGRDESAEDDDGFNEFYVPSQSRFFVHSKEGQNDDSIEIPYESDDENDSDSSEAKNHEISCSTDNNGLSCTSQLKRATPNFDLIESKEINDLNSDEGTSNGLTKESQYYVTTSPKEYHGDLVEKLSSSPSNSKLLTQEFSKNIADFQNVIDQTDADVMSLVLANERIYKDLVATASGGQGDYEYNSPQHQKLMDGMTEMLANVDKVRAQILDMQMFEQRLNYHVLLKALLKEIYGENQLTHH